MIRRQVNSMNIFRRANWIGKIRNFIDEHYLTNLLDILQKSGKLKNIREVDVVSFIVIHQELALLMTKDSVINDAIEELFKTLNKNPKTLSDSDKEKIINNIKNRYLAHHNFLKSLTVNTNFLSHLPQVMILSFLHHHYLDHKQVRLIFQGGMYFATAKDNYRYIFIPQLDLEKEWDNWKEEFLN